MSIIDLDVGELAVKTAIVSFVAAAVIGGTGVFQENEPDYIEITENQQYESVKHVFNSFSDLDEKPVENPVQYLDNNGWTQPEATRYGACAEQANQADFVWDPLDTNKAPLIMHCMKKGL